MLIVKEWRGENGSGYSFYCPGCDMRHSVRTEGQYAWSWNGSLDKPTFTPSVLVRGITPLTDDEVKFVMAGGQHKPVPFICHSFVTDGRIQFLGDRTHALAGQTVDLPQIPAS